MGKVRTPVMLLLIYLNLLYANEDTVTRMCEARTSSSTYTASVYFDFQNLSRQC